MFNNKELLMINHRYLTNLKLPCVKNIASRAILSPVYKSPYECVDMP